MLLPLFLLAAACVTAAANAVSPPEPISLKEFNSLAPEDKDSPPILALFCDFEKPDECAMLKANFDGLIAFQRERFANVRFFYVLDDFVPIMRQFPFFRDLPRLQFFEHGGKAKILNFFQTSKQGPHALDRYLTRMLAPLVHKLESDEQLVEFLLPKTDELRNALTEDTVSLLFIEPERGSTIAKSVFYSAAKTQMGKGFFAHIRLGEYSGDWATACNLTALPLSLPATYRMETGFPPKLLPALTSPSVLASPRLYLPTHINLGPHNFREVWESSLARKIILVLAFYSTPQERAAWETELVPSHDVAGEDDREGFWYATVDRNEYLDFFSQYVEESEHAVLALNRTGQTFWVLQRGAEVMPWLDRIASGEELGQHAEGWRALPRLGVKALRRNPHFVFPLIAMVLALVFALYGVLLLCTDTSEDTITDRAVRALVRFINKHSGAGAGKHEKEE